MTGDPYVRPVGHVRDLADGRLVVGVDYGAVTIGKRRLGSYQAAEFARLFADACMQAARQDGELTAAARAELRAASADMCLVDCGDRVHDEVCTPPPAASPVPWRPPCDLYGCVSHYDDGLRGCICPAAWFDDGYHLLRRLPKCRAHQLPARPPASP